MIVGSVNTRPDAMLSLQIEESSGQLDTIDPVIDTGFTGDLTLPTVRISALGLPATGVLIGQLADGSQQMISVHAGILWWDGYPIQVRIQAIGTDSLLGTGLLAGHELKVQFVPGGAVTITRIP
jgi:predicted aspartyl protease